MDKEEVNERILEKISLAIECISQNRDADFNEKISCVVCNLASAYKCLNK